MKSNLNNKSAAENAQHFEMMINFFDNKLSTDELKQIKGGGGEDDKGQEDAIIYM